jgi:uncharacterized protein
MVENYRYQYFIDEEGNWFCDGQPVEDRELAAFLSRCLVERGGSYLVACEGEVHPVTVADAPLVVRQVHRRIGAGGGLDQVEIELGDGRREMLDGETLEISPQHILYCRATDQGLRARFCRPAYYELMRHLEMEGKFERFYVAIGGRRYVIKPTREESVDRRDMNDA